MRRIFGIFILILILGVSGTILHELGHYVVIYFSDVDIVYFAVAPGLQLYPEIKMIPWEYWGIKFEIFYRNSFHFGWVELAGTLTTALIAFVSVSLLLFKKIKKRKVRILLFYLSFYYLDIVCYTFFPAFGYKHWFFFGGPMSEPLNGAMKIGIAPFNFFILIFIYFIVMTASIIRLYSQYKSDLIELKSSQN